MLIKNYLLVSLRTLVNDKSYTFLNLVGLTLGLSVSLLILLFVLHEYSFDRFHDDHERIYKLSRVAKPADGSDPVRYGSLPPALGPALRQEFPGVENVVRIANRRRTNVARPGTGDSTLAFVESSFRVTDPSFFEVFSFELIKGDPKRVLSQPLTMVLSERMAEKYFGTEDPVGKTLVLNNEHEVTVTGVVENPPANSSITYDFLLSMDSWQILLPFGNPPDQNWNSFVFQTFVKLKPGGSIGEITKLLPEYVRERSRLARQRNISVDRAEPLSALYLHSSISQNLLGPTGNAANLLIFTFTALFTLLIAAFNYMNLATARSLSRAKEVGVRKASGATRKQLALQFYTEAAIMVLVSIPIAVWIVYMILPGFEQLIRYRIDFAGIGLLKPSLILLSLVLLAAAISGSYPALVLSRFNPADVLKGRYGFSDGKTERIIRVGLVGFQFVLSVVLISGALTIGRQVEYMRSSTFLNTPGKILTLNLFRFPSDQLESLKQELQKLPYVRRASVSFNVPFRKTSFAGSRNEEYVRYYMDEDFLETYGLNLVAGRGFSERYLQADRGSAVIINETALKRHSEQGGVVDRRITLGDQVYTVVGVVEDFHFESLREPIKPLYMVLRPDFAGYLSLRLSGGEVGEKLAGINSVWGRFTERAMEYDFMEDMFGAMYQPEWRLAGLFRYFTVIAVVIALLGIFGLSGYMAEQRKAEIGLRKVFGARAAQIIGMLSRDFMIVLGSSLVIALPLAYWGLQQWLQNFTYRIDLTGQLMLGAALIPLSAGLAVALFHAWRASRANPVENLRTD